MNKHLDPNLSDTPPSTPDTLNSHGRIPASNEQSHHKVSAIYPSIGEAEGVRDTLISNGFTPDQVKILNEYSPEMAADYADDSGSDAALKDMLVDGAIGTAIGTGVGAAGTLMLAAANVTLFVASPVIGTLTMLGWFAGIGGFIGAALGAEPKASEPKTGNFTDLVKDAIKSSNGLLVVRTYSDEEQRLAKSIITDSLRGRDDAVMEVK